MNQKDLLRQLRTLGNVPAPETILSNVKTLLSLDPRKPQQSLSRDTIKQAFSHPKWQVRLEAVHMMFSLGAAAPIDLILTALDDENKYVRAEALSILERLEQKDQIDSAKILLALNDPQSIVRIAAADLLGMLGNDTALPALEKVLADEDEDVCRAAKHARETLLQQKAIKPDMDTKQSTSTFFLQAQHRQEKNASIISSREALKEQPEPLDSEFIMTILKQHSRASGILRFSTITSIICQDALRRLDPDHRGLAIKVMQCMPPSKNTMKVRSLRESVGQGTSLWETDNLEGLFLGCESLAGQAILRGRITTVHNFEDERTKATMASAYRIKDEMSMIASPIVHEDRVAGSLLLLSTQPYYFFSPVYASLIEDYTELLTLAFSQEDFYPRKYIDLATMPPLSIQRASFATYKKRLEQVAVKTPLSSAEGQVEKAVWCQYEEEFIQHLKV